MADNNGNDEIKVSRDALRADLAEMELRLRGWIGEQLALKADAAAFLAMQRELTQLKQDAVLKSGPTAREIERLSQQLNSGGFTRPQERTIQEMIEAELSEKSTARWTVSQRLMGAALFIVTAGSFVFALLSTRGGG